MAIWLLYQIIIVENLTICLIQPKQFNFLKFVYFEKATKFCEIFTLLTVHTDKSKVKISQNCVASSEYMNFKDQSQWFNRDIYQTESVPPIGRLQLDFLNVLEYLKNQGCKTIGTIGTCWGTYPVIRWGFS